MSCFNRKPSKKLGKESTRSRSGAKQMVTQRKPNNPGFNPGDIQSCLTPSGTESILKF